MYEQMTFRAILQRMLDRAPADVDKREGSILYDALAPAAMELAQVYAELDRQLNLSFADTATGEFLSRRTAEYGIRRQPSTKAKRKGLFYDQSNAPVDVPIGSRYSIASVTFAAVGRLAAGQYVMECETAGVIGNGSFGAMLPIDYVPGLARAELADVLVPGEDEETDAALRQRYFEALNERPFGGNIADYKQKIGDIPGVGGVKITPAWQGGGTVKATLIASDYSAPSATLLDEVQTAIDPVENQGLGIGLAPIGHSVTITGVEPVPIDVETTLTLAAGVTIAQVQEEVEAVIGQYLLTLRQQWASEAQLVVRVSLIDAQLLTVSGVVDVTGTTLNGGTGNVTLQGDQIPTLGTVTIH
jgi:uncharacterized phage protein gp47/JayE